MIADSPGPRAPREEGTAPESSPSREGWWLYLCAFATTLLAFAPALSIPFSYDDLDVLDVVALWRTGEYRFVDLLFLPHNEHLIPACRLAFSASTWEFGTDTRFFHLALFALHAVGAWAVGRLAGAAGAGRTGRFAAAISYGATAGFAGTAVWYPTAAVVMGAWVAVLVGLAQFFRAPAPGSPARAALWSAAGLAATTGALPGLAAPWLAFVLASFGPAGPERRRARRAAIALTLGGVVVLVLMRTAYARYSGQEFPSPSLQGLPAFLKILGTAPGHFLITAVGALSPADSLKIVASVAGWLLAGWAFLRAVRNGRQGRDVLLSLWGGAIALAFAIGLNRPNLTFAALPASNRYYYSFAAPLCISLGLLIDAFPGRRRLWRVGAAILLAALLLGERRNLLPSLNAVPNAATIQFWGHADLLARLLAAEAGKPGAPPWTLTDGLVPYPGIHDGSLALRTILRTTFPRPIAGERFAPGATVEDRRRQNEVLDRWADAMGNAVVPICATPTGLGPPAAALSVVDFRVAMREDAVVSGLYEWEQPFRWMGPRSRLRLASASGDLVVRAWTPPAADLAHFGAKPFEVEARLGGTPLGTFRFDPAGGEQIARFPIAGRIAPDGRPVVIDLASSQIWRPSENMKDSNDTRALTIGLIAVGFSTEALEKSVPTRCLDRGASQPPNP
ncbi:MAG: hypothetical protein ABJC13_06515 [Acidobacteriota bacterium]